MINYASSIFIARGRFAARERERELNIVSRYSGKFLFERTFSIFDWLRDDFNLSVIFPVSVSRNDSIGEFT